MKDKELLEMCLKFAKNLNILLESKSDQVLAFTYKKLPEIEKEIIESSYKQITDNEQIEQLAYPYQSYILYKYLKEKTDINELYKICVNHITLFQRYRDRLKPEEQSIISEHLLKLPALEFKDELNQLANMIERERETKGKKKTAVFKKEEEKPYFEDENVIIRDIKSREDAIKYGCDTRWCIAAPNNSMFSAYTLGGSQFVFYENKKTNDKFAFVSIHESNKELLKLCNIGGSQHSLQNDIIVFDKDDKSYIPERIINNDEFLPEHFNTIKSLLNKKSNGGLTEEFLKLYKSQELIQNDQTRKYFSMSPLTSFAYFYLIDKEIPSEVTYNGVKHSPDIAEIYLKKLDPILPLKKNYEYLLVKNPIILSTILLNQVYFKNYEERIPELIKHKLFNESTLRNAILRKHQKIAELLIDSGCPVNIGIFDMVINQRNTKLFEKLIQNRPLPESSHRMLERAVELGQKTIVELLIQAKCSMSALSLNLAAYNTNEKIVNLLIQAGCPMESTALYQAIKKNNSKIVKSLVQAKCPMDSGILDEAVRQKNPEIVESLVRAKCPMDRQILYKAIDTDAGYDIISILLQHGCPIYDDTVSYAIEKLGRDARVTKLLEIYYKRKKPVSFANMMKNLDKKDIQRKREENGENFEDIMDIKKKYKLKENKTWEELWDAFMLKRE